MSVTASRFSLSDENDAAGDGESDIAWRGVRLDLGRIEEAFSVTRFASFSSTEDMFAKRAIFIKTDAIGSGGRGSREVC